MTNEVFANSPSPGRVAPIAVLAGNGGQVSSSATSINIASPLPAALQSGGQFHALIDSELVIIPTQSGTTLAGVVRGVEGSTAASHLDAASIYPLLTAGALENALAPAAKVVALGSVTGVVTCDLSQGVCFTGTLAGNVTINFSNWPASPALTEPLLILTQDATGGHAITITGVVWEPNGTPPTFNAAPGAVNIIPLSSPDQGAHLYGSTGGSGTTLIPTAVKTSAYTAAVSDFVPVDVSGGSVTVTLPATPSDKSQIGVKLINGAAGNTLTVTTGGSDVFNKTSGATSLALTGQNQSLLLQYAASSGIWYVLAVDSGAGVVTGRTVSKSTTYTISSTDQVVLVDATSAAFTVTLPTAAGFYGRYVIRAVNTNANLVTVATTSSQTIDGASSATVGPQNSGATWVSLELVSDGANWRSI